MKVFPIGITQGNINQLIEIVQESLGYSPTRGLDAAGLDIKDPAAFLSILKLDNKPLDTLRQKSAIWEHFSISFIVVVPADVIIGLANLGNIKIFSKAGKREYVAILSGTMAEWYDVILAGCSPKTDSDVRLLTSNILLCFDRVGFREIFSKFVHIIQSDSSIILGVNRGN